MYRSSLQEVFCKKRVLRNSAKLYEISKNNFSYGTPLVADSGCSKACPILPPKSKTDRFASTGNVSEPLTIVAKLSFLDVFVSP